MKRKFSEIHMEYVKYKEDERDFKLLYDTLKNCYKNEVNLDIILEKIYLKNKLEDYKGSTFENYINILIVVITTIVTIVLEKSISEASNYILGIISIIISAPVVFFILLKLDKKIIRREIDKHIYYSVCLEVIDEIESNMKNTENYKR